ncbi:DUF4132 domain-containing protein [Streptomyces sp. NPDC021115]|uniref:DUF4132 domain-containing protein n=1 Tax=Streptomyces sp. NPDC021115 TaxID=3365115 RepID=UPI00379CDCD4
MPAIHGHELALDGTSLRCRKANGQILKSIPSAVRHSPVGEQFAALQDQLARHEKECRATVESWLLGGIPVPAGLLARVWPAPGWRTRLQHLVVFADGQTGLLKKVSAEGRVCLRERDGALYEPPVASPVTLMSSRRAGRTRAVAATAGGAGGHDRVLDPGLVRDEVLPGGRLLVGRDPLVDQVRHSWAPSERKVGPYLSSNPFSNHHRI